MYNSKNNNIIPSRLNIDVNHVCKIALPEKHCIIL